MPYVDGWPWLPGATIVCIAGGPSLTKADCDLVAAAQAAGDCVLFGVNDAYRIVPVQLVYGGDQKWWHTTLPGGGTHASRTKAIDTIRWRMCAQDSGAVGGIIKVPGKDCPNLSREPGFVHYGGNGGYQLINVAYLVGAARIVLLGYDCGYGANNQCHWFGQHPPGVHTTSNYAEWQRKFSTIDVPDCEILNASRRTAITAFPRVRLCDAIRTRPTARQRIGQVFGLLRGPQLQDGSGA